jgi:hypothetical protein
MLNENQSEREAFAIQQSTFSIQHFFNRRRDLLGRRVLALATRDVGVVNHARAIDQEHSRPGDVVGVESPRMPDAVRLGDFTRLVDQNLER